MNLVISLNSKIQLVTPALSSTKFSSRRGYFLEGKIAKKGKELCRKGQTTIDPSTIDTVTTNFPLDI